MSARGRVCEGKGLSAEGSVGRVREVKDLLEDGSLR